jgi:hypothetical protein
VAPFNLQLRNAGLDRLSLSQALLNIFLLELLGSRLSAVEKALVSGDQHRNANPFAALLCRRD